ncbi:hypothetical protein PA27867_3587 [Cryobacterium arcticum]|uniref:Uncharacterized protein n=1 Tax=Cryobacterium arcticum TaxID=670052 RepID=A0A1B1BPP7_9MICO|nr:hypothetical protein PA27867_3587 [Cryobacterium arcticum]
MTKEELDQLPSGCVVVRSNEPFIDGRGDRYEGMVRLWYGTGTGAFRSEWMAKEHAELVWRPAA